MNTEAKNILLKVKEQILASPRNFCMSRLVSGPERINNEVDLPRRGCGTVFCIAGRIASDTSIGHAALALGVDYWTSKTLFFVCDWPEPFQSDWYKCRTLTGRAKVAAKRIDAFIKEN